MRLILRTPVQGNYQKVLSQFNQDLLEALTPPGATVELIRFDGSHEGDIVHIRLSLFGLIKQDWVVEIPEEGFTEQKAWFVDRGTQLPFFLSQWEHHHIVERTADHSTIVDDIRFGTPWWLPAFLMYPVLYLQFAYRKPIYQRIFGKPDA
ncbi:MAG: hypothetical protein AAF587_34225 [Bacteroidota bacterium]